MTCYFTMRSSKHLEVLDMCSCNVPFISHLQMIILVSITCPSFLFKPLVFVDYWYHMTPTSCSEGSFEKAGSVLHILLLSTTKLFTLSFPKQFGKTRTDEEIKNDPTPKKTRPSKTVNSHNQAADTATRQVSV